MKSIAIIRILREPKSLSLIVMIAVLIAIPWMVQEIYVVHMMIWIFFYSILCQTFRFNTLIGDWSFAHVPLMGVGGYASALFVMRLGWPFSASFIMAGFMAIGVGLVVYKIAIRTKGVTFFWVTWGLGEIVRQMWIRFEIFGKHRGLSSIPGASISLFGFSEVNLTSQTHYYYLGLSLFVVTFITLYFIERGRLGLTAKSICENRDLAASYGINVEKFRLLILFISTFFVGINGSFAAHWNHYINPNDYGLSFSLLVLLYVIVGGIKTMLGPVLGVIIFVFLGQALQPLQEYTMVVYGAILIVVLRFLPGGMVGLPGLVLPRIKKLFVRIGKESKESGTS